MTNNDEVPRPFRFPRLLAIGIALAAVGCAPRPVMLGQTQIGQGKLYQSGSVTYDRFFQDTHAVQLEVMRAEEDEAMARAPLEKALEARGAPLEKLYELALARAKKGGDDAPPLVYVVVTGLDPDKESKETKDAEPVKDASNKEGAKEGSKENLKELPRKVTVAVGPELGAVPADQKGFVKALTETARAEAEILDRFTPIVAKAGELSAHCDELADGVEKEFPTRKLRKDVNQELSAAKLILGATEDRAREVSARARSFLKGLSEALKPPPEAPPPPPPPAEKSTAKAARPRKGSGRPPRTTSAEPAPPRTDAPPAKPAPRPTPAEDFNP